MGACTRCGGDCCSCSGCAYPVSASDGTVGCTRCIGAYQNQLNVIAQQQSQLILQQMQQQQSQTPQLIHRPG